MKFEGNHELPSLIFIEDEGILKIWGRSIATEAKADFWEPLLEKIEVSMSTPRDMVVSIDLEFFATSSAKALLQMFKLLAEKSIENKRNVLVKWFYDDEEMLEAGEDFCEMVRQIEWKYVDKNDEDIND